MDKAIELLMVEDNRADIRFSQEYLKGYRVPNHLSVVKDEVEALRFLRGQGVYALAALPDIILISIRVLWMNNASSLKQIKRDATLAHIPIVIMTGSEGEEASLGDDLSFDLCLTKPLNLDCLFTVVKDILDFSLTTGRAMSTPQRNRPEPFVFEISHPLTLKPIQNNLAKLLPWKNVGGNADYVHASR
jgi:two-component system response regulator